MKLLILINIVNSIEHFVNIIFFVKWKFYQRIRSNRVKSKNKRAKQRSILNCKTKRPNKQTHIKQIVAFSPQEENRRGNKLRHVLFHVDDRPTINKHGQDEEPLPSTGTKEKTRRSSTDGEIEPQKKPIFIRLEPRNQIWWIYESGKNINRLQSNLLIRVSCMWRTGIFDDRDKFKDA